MTRGCMGLRHLRQRGGFTMLGGGVRMILGQAVVPVRSGARCGIERLWPIFLRAPGLRRSRRPGSTAAAAAAAAAATQTAVAHRPRQTRR
jgi:hypothetical protein